MVDARLREFATERQWQILEAVESAGSQRGAARLLGCNKNIVPQAIEAVNKRAAAAGYSPDHDMTHTAPAGFNVRGTSTLYKDGEVSIQWVKTQADQESRLEAVREAVAGLVADAPRMAPIPAPVATLSELLNLYVLTDFHMGMLAHHSEGGENFDLKIARNLLVKTFSQMMAQSPDAETGFVCQLGDFLHSDFPALNGVTPLSGHGLDTDGRPSKVIDATIHVLRALVDMALTKHAKVIVLMAEGNHDIVSSLWLQALFSALYENDPRVEVIKSPLPYYCTQHGSTSLFFHHGHLRKLPALGGVFAAQFPEIWGQTKYRYAHTGHLHYKIRMEEKEDMGVTITQHRTLAAKDAYSARGGYFSERKAECLTYSKQNGLVSTVHVTPGMVE
jgi:hypothetical protein